MLIESVLTAFVVLLIYYYLFPQKKWKLPPGPSGYPFLGNIFSIGKRPYVTYTNWQKKYGDILTCRFGSNRIFLLGDMKMVKECFNEPIFTGRPADMVLCLLSKGKHGIIASDGSEWVDQRRFTLRHMRNFGFGKNYMEGLIMDEVNEFIDWLKREEGNPIDMNEKFELAVLNSLWFIITGKKFKQDDSRHLDMIRKIDEVFTKPSMATLWYIFSPKFANLLPKFTGIAKFNQVVVEFHEMLKEIIKEHEDTLPEDENNARDFIDVYLHEIKKSTDSNSSFHKEAGVHSLLAIVGDLFLAGSETTSATMSWTILYLALNSEIQAKLQEEIDQIVGKSRPVALADRPNLPYAEATVNEIFRKSSIVVSGVMHTAMEDTQFHGYDVPKGTWMMPNIYGIHHDSKIWGDPENFRPERFLSADGKTFVKNENLLPFSVGRRACIGENLARDEIYLFMTNIFQRFTVKPDPFKPMPTYMPKETFLLKPEDYLVVMKERNI